MELPSHHQNCGGTSTAVRSFAAAMRPEPTEMRSEPTEMRSFSAEMLRRTLAIRTLFVRNASCKSELRRRVDRIAPFLFRNAFVGRRRISDETAEMLFSSSAVTAELRRRALRLWAPWWGPWHSVTIGDGVPPLPRISVPRLSCVKWTRSFLCVGANMYVCGPWGSILFSVFGTLANHSLRSCLSPASAGWLLTMVLAH